MYYITIGMRRRQHNREFVGKWVEVDMCVHSRVDS
jgi:hypothetical protein